MNDVVKSAWANAQANNDFINIKTYSGYTLIMWDQKGASHVLPPDADDEQLGFAIMDALAHSRFILPAPPDSSVWIHPEAGFDPEFYDQKIRKPIYEDWIKSIMKRFRYKTKSAMFKGMRNCNIIMTAGVIIITPLHRVRSDAWDREGLTPEDDVVISTNSGNQAIGKALRLALSRCT
jgi:hypothetical protein